jgi:sugar phosphate isomerase/epimerase
MKLALQLRLIPQESTHDKVKWAKDHGAEGIELGAGTIDAMVKEADDLRGVLPVTTVCGNTVDGKWTFDFLDPDIAKRRACLDGSKAILKFCGKVGAVGQIVPPIFGPPRVPDLSPFMNPIQLEDELAVAMLKELGPWAAEHKTMFLLEPLNRYEQHYLRKQSDALKLMERAKAKGVGLLSDFFHMHIEETSTPQAFKECGKHTTHVHLADNTRMEPGTGDIDFVAGFKALKEAGFKGYMAYECGISGDNDEQRRKNLAKSLDYMRDCIAKAKK